MIKFRTGVKIRSGIKMGHSVSVEESSLDIRLKRNPDLIYIQYNGAGVPIITYTQGFGKFADQIDIEEPTYYSTVYIAPFTPEGGGGTYNCVKAAAWTAGGKRIASN